MLLCFLIQPLFRGKGRNPYKNFVGFLVFLKTPIGHFEINWPLETWYLFDTHFDSNLKHFPNNLKYFSLNSFFFIILFVRWHINFWTSMLTVLKLVVAVGIQNMIFLLLFLHVKVIKNSHSKVFFSIFFFQNLFSFEWNFFNQMTWGF